MHPLLSVLTTVGQYAKWAETHKLTEGHPLFAYSEKCKKKALNQNLKTLCGREIKVCRHMPVSSDPLYILNIPFTLSYDGRQTYDQNKEQAKNKWNNLTRIIRDESFGADIFTSREQIPSRVQAIIGVNRSASLSREEDDHFKTLFSSLPLEAVGFNCRVISTLWKSEFVLAGEKEINHEVAQIAFIVLEYLQVNLARDTKNNLECSVDLKTKRQHIPFIHIREWIKNTMLEMVDRLPSERLERQPIYMCTMDDDAVGFRGNAQGLFSEYDDIVRSRQIVTPLVTLSPIFTAPQLMSTGYFASNYEDIGTQLGISEDMGVRENISQDLPLGPYYPEPNSLFLINDGAIRARLSFMSTLESLVMENRRLINNIRWVLDLSRVVFAARKCFFTTIALRMRVSKPLRSYHIRDLGQKQVLKSLKGISQTHASGSKLNNCIWIALQPPKPSQNRVAFKKPFFKIFNCFDPIALAQSFPNPKGNTRYTYECFNFLMKIYPSFVESLWKAFERDESQMHIWSSFAAEKSGLPVKVFEGAFKGYWSDLYDGFLKAEKELGRSQAILVAKVAKKAGQAIYEVLNQNLVR